MAQVLEPSPPAPLGRLASPISFAA
eukprot:SAG31_NODE_39904_length_284_cov_1.383784_1_plen_24_part_01